MGFFHIFQIRVRSILAFSKKIKSPANMLPKGRPIFLSSTFNVDDQTGSILNQTSFEGRGLYFFQKCQNRPDPYLEDVKKAHTLIFWAQILAQNVTKTGRYCDKKILFPHLNHISIVFFQKCYCILNVNSSNGLMGPLKIKSQ